MKNVWVNGCFDLIHGGHIDLLRFAKSLNGDQLIVGLDSDERIRKFKGKYRPILRLEERMKIISAFSFVDKVVSFNNDNELKNHIINNNIGVMVVGEEYKYEEVVGSEHTRIIAFYPRIEGKSSTNIVNKILSEYCK